METLRTISLKDIDPADFQNTTILVEPVGSPKDAFLAVVEIPRMPVGEGGGAVTCLNNAPVPQGHSRFLTGPFIVPYDIFVNGGESGGLKLPGILEEAELIYGSREQ